MRKSPIGSFGVGFCSGVDGQTPPIISKYSSEACIEWLAPSVVAHTETPCGKANFIHLLFGRSSRSPLAAGAGVRAQASHCITPQREPISVVARITQHRRCGRSLSSGSSSSSTTWVGHAWFAPWESWQPWKSANVPDSRRRMIYKNVYQTCVRVKRN